MESPISPDILPLEGLCVVDFTTALSGPYATQTLGDLGADVIKVERPEGDDSRHWGPPFVGDTASYFLSINRNKRSIALNLKDEADLAVARELVAQADIVMENFRPGVADRLGLGYESVRDLNGSVVYCSISGFGQTRPSRPGYDQVVQATSGWMSLTGFADSEPTRTGVPVGDVAAGMAAVQGVLAALLRRERTGQGGYVDISMQDTLMSMLAYQGGRYFATGEAPPRSGNSHPTVAPYGRFPTGDGAVVMSVGNNAQFARFAQAFSLVGLTADDRFTDNRSRAEHRTELTDLIVRCFADFTTEDVLRRLGDAGVPAGPINDLHQAFESEDAVERGMALPFQTADGFYFKAPGGALRIDNANATVRKRPPALNEHSSQIRSELASAAVSAAN